MKKITKIAFTLISSAILLFIISDGVITATTSTSDEPNDSILMNFLNGFLDKFENSLNYLKNPPIFPGFIKEDKYLLVTYAPSNVYWDEIDIGESSCILPEGEINPGDIISNCSGLVVLTYKPAKQVLGTWEFDRIINNNQNESDDDNTDPPIDDPDDDIELISPEIKITKPKEKSFYFLNNKKRDSDITKIIGKIEILTDINNPSNYGISKVNFYINDELKESDETYPYSWIWNERIINKHCTIKAELIGLSGSVLDSDEILVLITNFGFF